MDLLDDLLKSDALRLYGLRTALYGTLFRTADRAIVPRAATPDRSGGHELGVHGHDHDTGTTTPFRRAKQRSRARSRGTRDFREIMDAEPVGFCRSRVAMRRRVVGGDRTRTVPLPIEHTRLAPHRPRAGGVAGRLPEIPTTLPTIDECSETGIRCKELLDRCVEPSRNQPLEVLTVHAEVEGGPYLELFDHLLERLRERVRFERLADVASRLDVGALPECEIVQATRAGRAGTVSCQSVPTDRA